jgi:DNA-binding GntR family transcriptional regulator
MADTIDPVDTEAVRMVKSLLRRRETTMATRWERVAEAIRDQIRTGKGLRVEKDGSRWLPSYAKLGDQHDVSYGTVLAAMRQLRAEGWIHDGEQGVGVRVREDHPA